MLLYIVMKNIIGKKYGRLTVICFAGNMKIYKYLWDCLCDCGNKRIVAGSHLKNGHTSSCGCYKNEVLVKRATTHGLTHTLEYKTWESMKKRCDNTKNHDYERYGGRGITYCERWKKVENFFDDMGNKPTPQHSLDRIDNNGNYCKENCRWATNKEQSNNKRNNVVLTYKGVSLNLSQWAEIVNMCDDTIIARIRVCKWSVEDALFKPVRITKKKLQVGLSKT